MLVVKDDVVLALVEIKSNMGWCRDATKVIDDEILRMHKGFTKLEHLTCKFSKNETREVEYSKDTKVYFLSLTSQNGGKAEDNEKNIKYANSRGVDFYMLFDGWYDCLTDRDIDKFIDSLLDIS